VLSIMHFCSSRMKFATKAKQAAKDRARLTFSKPVCSSARATVCCDVRHREQSLPYLSRPKRAQIKQTLKWIHSIHIANDGKPRDTNMVVSFSSLRGHFHFLWSWACCVLRSRTLNSTTALLPFGEIADCFSRLQCRNRQHHGKPGRGAQGATAGVRVHQQG